MSTVQEALAARKKRNQGQIQSALEKSRERRYNKFQKEGADFHDRVNAEIESASKIANTWGANAVADAQANTSENLTRLKALKRELDLYKGFLTEESYKSFDTALSGLGNAYDIYLKNAEIRANFDNEDAYNTWYEGYKAELEEQAKMQKEDLGALKGEVEALQKSREELLTSGSDGEAWYEKFGRWLGGGATDTSLPTVGVSPSQTVGVDERITALNDLINQKQDYIQKVDKSQTAANYAALAFKDDFDENSAYKSTRYGDPVGSAWQRGAYTDTGYRDIEYDYINRDPNARSIKDAEAVAYGSTFAGADESFYKEMTPEEVAIFNYIYKTESPEAAYAYVDFLRADLDARKRKTEEAFWAKEAEESPFRTSIFSSIISPLKSATFVGQVGDYLDDGSVDQNAGYNRFSHINSAIRNEVSGNIDSGVGKFAYQTGMSMADSLVSVGLSGGNSTVSSVIMGTGAAADTIIMAKDRGLSDNQAMGLGIIAGAAEMLTEKMSIEALLDATGLKKSVVGYIIKNALTEAGEELTSSTVNLFADILISKDKSEWQMSIDQYKKDNPQASDGEAFWHAVREQALAIGLDTLGGLVSGGVMGGGGAAIGTVVNTIKQNNAYKQHGQELIEQGAVDPIKRFATEWVAQNAGDDAGPEISSLVDAKGTAKNIGKLSAKLEGAIAKQNKAEVENALIDKGIPKRDARKIADYLTGESTSISDKLKDAIDNSENIKSIVKDVIENPESAVNERRGRLLEARLGIDNSNSLAKALNSDTESDIIKESEVISDESTDGIHLRNGSKRNDGQNTEESVFDLESSTGKNQSRRKAEQFADGEAARLVNEGREVSTADLGVLGGSKEHTVRLLDTESDPSLMTPLMKRAYTEAAKRGLNLRFFVGGNLVIADSDGKLFAARGYILGNTMLVRADHPYYTSDQLTRHEIGHDMIAKGEVNIDEVRKKLAKIADKESVDYIAEKYVEAYKGTNLTPEEIWEECICDSLGDMNIFGSEKEENRQMSKLIPSVKEATESTTKSPTQTRGSPEGKTSREANGDKLFVERTPSRVKAKGTNYNLDVREYSLREIRSIFEANNNNSEFDILFNKAYSFCENVNVSIMVAPTVTTKDGEQRSGVARGDKITLSQRYFNDSRVSSERKVQTILHEMLHSATIYAIKAYEIITNEGGTEKMQSNLYRACKKISSVYATIKVDPRFANEYGIKNEKEFVAELSNPHFVEKLKNTYASPWHKILEAICELLGIDKNFSMYGKLKRAVDDILSDPDYELARDYYSLVDQNAYYLEESQYEDISNRGKASRELDSFGNELSKEQAEYFKDSKIRDDKGNLKVMYHGSPESFTVFDKKKAKSSGTYGKGFYFTDSTSHAATYGRSYEVYLNITNPLKNGTNDITKEQIRRFVEALAENEDYGIDNYGYDATVDSVTDSVYGKSDFAMIMDLNISCVGNMVEAIELFNEVNGTNYNGIVAPLETVAFYSNQIKKTDNLTPTSDPDIRYSRELDTIDYIDEQAEREGTERVGVEPLSNREILANALESIAQNEIEQNKLKEYKDNISKMNTESAKLAELKKEIKELTFGKGEKNPEKLKALKAEATKTENRINLYDKKLLSLETASVLKDVLEREKRKAYSRAAQKGREAMHRNVEGRHKTEMRHKINKVAHELDALLNRGTKERNVKKGQSALVRSALDLSDMLFATDDELIVGGIVTELSNREKLAVAEFKVLYDEYHSYDESVTENKEKRKELRTQMNEKKKALAEALERERKRISEAKAQGIFTALADEYSALKDSKDSYIALAYKPEVLQFLNSLKESVGENVTLKDMTLAQLEAVYKAFSMVKKTVQDSNKIFRRGRAEDLDKRLDSIYGEIDKVTTLRDKVDVDLPDIINTPIEWVNKFSWNNLRPVDAFDRIGSKAFDDLYWDIIKAQSTYASDISEVATALENARKKYGFEDWKTKDIIGTFKTAEGQTFTLTLREAMSIYAYSKRDQADAHLREGGFQFEKDAVYKKKGFLVRRKNTADTYRVGDRLRAEIISKLTKAQKAYVDEMQALLTSWGEKGNEQSRLLYGIDLFTETVYFPLFSSKDYISSVQNEIGSTVTSASILSQGMTQATKPGANNPIVLRGFDDVILEHFDKMSKYHAYAVTIDNMRKVIDSNNRQGVAFRSILREKYGVGAEQYLENYLKDLNGSATVSGAKNPIESFFGKSKGVAVSANISVWSQQYFSIIRAAAEVNPKYFIPFLGEKFKNPDLRLYEEMKKYAPITVIKEMGGFDVGANSGLADYIGQDNAALSKEKVGKAFQDYLGIGATAMDKLGWITIWSAVKKEVAATGKYPIGSVAYLKACGERFEEVIVRTQVYDSVNARSGFMRSKYGTVKYLTSFMGEPTVIVGMASTSLIKVIRNPKDVKAWGRLATNMAAITLAQAMTTVVKSLVAALRDKDKDEKYWEKYAQALGRNFSDDLNPLNYLPVFRDLVSIWNGYDIERPDISLIGDAITAFQKLIDDDATAEEWLNLAMTTASLFGLPLKNIVRDVSGIARTIANSNNGYKSSKAKHFAEGWSDEQGTRYEDLYYSMIEDDEKRLEYYKSTYKTESAYGSAIRSSIGEQYKNGNISRSEASDLLAEYGGYDSNETYWKLKEWDFEIENGDDAEYSKYDIFYEAVKTGRNLKAVIKEYTDHGVDKETLASQITTEYKPLYKNMSNAERANIKGYLLNAYVLLGYDRAKKSKDIDKWLK